MITICIPTYNRSEFLDRLLRYYSDVDCKFKILVGDSSPIKTYEENLKIRENLTISEQIKFVHTPGKNVVECMSILLDQVDTPHSILNPDDDYLVPSVLEKMSRILNNDQSISGVNGKALLCNTNDMSYTRYMMRPIINKDASNRLLNLSNSYFGILFALFRTEHMIECYTIPEISSPPIRQELYSSFVAATNGKIQHLNDLFLVRTVGHDREKLGTLDDADSKSLAVFKDNISRKISLIDDIHLEAAAKVFDASIKNYRYRGTPQLMISTVRKYLEYYPSRIVLRFLQKILKQPLSIYELIPCHPWHKTVKKISSLYS